MKMEWKSWNAEVENRIFSGDKSISGSDFDGPLFLDTGPAVVMTPIGDWYEDSPSRPSKMWQCFTCYTDFDIGTRAFLNLMESIKGVEYVEILGNYTFFIGFGMLFDAKQMREEIFNEVQEKYVEP